MNFKEFSKALILTQDLDPDYVFISEIQKRDKLSHADVLKWIILKIFVYDTASEMQILRGRTNFERAHYGAERRKSRYSAEANFKDMYTFFRMEELPLEFTAAKQYLTAFNGVGDWAAWKFCDMLERILNIPIDFSKTDFRRAYEYPLRGLCAVNNQPDDFVSYLKDDDELYQNCMDKLPELLGDVLELDAPPNATRKINLQEIETCLCKYHSHLKNRYKIGQDTTHLINRFKEEKLSLPINLLVLHKNPLSL